MTDQPVKPRMKLRELISELSKHDQNLDVYFTIGVGCCGDYECLDEPEITVYNDSKKKEDHFIQLWFPGLEFLRSCLKVAAAKRLAEKK